MSLMLPEFCADWFRVEGRPDAERRAYVVSELKRLEADGAPILTAILACSDGRTQAMALDLVTRNTDGQGGRILAHRGAWALRIVEGGVPPAVDPQNRKLAPADVGKVLVVKVGTLGGDLDAKADAREVAQWGAEGRQDRARKGRDLYRLERVTHAGGSYTLEDAITILRRWGVGIGPREFASGTGQLLWLVEEVPPVRVAEDATTGAPKSKRAA